MARVRETHIFFLLGGLICSHFGKVLNSPIELSAEGCEYLHLPLHKLLIKPELDISSFPNGDLVKEFVGDGDC